jgi:hypothetical protein
MNIVVVATVVATNMVGKQLLSDPSGRATTARTGKFLDTETLVSRLTLMLIVGRLWLLLYHPQTLGHLQGQETSLICSDHRIIGGHLLQVAVSPFPCTLWWRQYLANTQTQRSAR